MTTLSQLVELGAGKVLELLETSRLGPASPTPRPGTMVVERQVSNEAPPPEFLGNTEFEVPLAPGFTETPSWGNEVWSLKSFQVTLKGSILVEDELELEAGQSFTAILGLRQFGRLIWSSDVTLPMLAVPGALNKEFTFKVGVYVDLQNGLPYTAAMPMEFVLFGVTPGFKKPPPPEGE